MQSNQDYRERVRQAIESRHGCSAAYHCSVFVHLESMWRGDVEVFDLRGHPKADRCYAWVHSCAKGEEQLIVLLHQPPYTSAKAAVEAVLDANAGADEITRAAA